MELETETDATNREDALIDRFVKSIELLEETVQTGGKTNREIFEEFIKDKPDLQDLYAQAQAIDELENKPDFQDADSLLLAGKRAMFFLSWQATIPMYRKEHPEKSIII